jgi:hypothetical protein
MDMKKWLSLLLCLILSPALAEVYKWEDKDGGIHYSDRSPEEGVEPIELPKGVYYTPTPLPETGAEEEEEQESEDRYLDLSIDKPEMNETIYSNEGTVKVKFTLTPGPVEGDEFQVFLDGQKIGKRGSTTSVKLDNVDRGSHTVKVQVFSDGDAKATSQSVVFHLRRESLETESGSSGDNTEAFTPDYTPDATSSEDYDSTESADYDDGIPKDEDQSEYTTVDPDDASKTVYDSATKKIPTVKGGAQFKSGSTYTPNYNQKK